MPKSKVRKKPTKKANAPRAKFEAHDPVLGAVLAERNWRFLTEGDIADAWDFPGLHGIGMNSMIATQPSGYAVDYFLEGQSKSFKSTSFPSREAVIEQLDFIETWGHEILELRELMK